MPAPQDFRPFFVTVSAVRLRAARFDADKPRALCLLLNGQTEFIEKYFEVIDELRARGFAVAALDWRGQGGSSRLHTGDPLKAHINDFSQYDADLDALMDQMVTPMLTHGARPIGLAHSMGGNLLLRHLHHHPGRFAAAVCCAPMLQFSTRGQPRWLVQAITHWMVARKRGSDFVWGMHLRDPITMPFSVQIVTSDEQRFARTQNFLKEHPDLRLAGPTWGWVAAASRAIAQMAAPGYAEAITTPVLICGAGSDQVVVTEAEKNFAARMPAGVYQEIEGAEHEILMERDAIREQFWRAFDAFVDEHT